MISKLLFGNISIFWRYRNNILYVNILLIVIMYVTDGVYSLDIIKLSYIYIII